MLQKGFALVELLIVAAILAVIAGGGFYLKSIKSAAITKQEGETAVQAAKEVTGKMASSTQAEQDIVDQMNNMTSTAETSIK